MNGPEFLIEFRKLAKLLDDNGAIAKRFKVDQGTVYCWLDGFVLPEKVLRVRIIKKMKQMLEEK